MATTLDARDVRARAERFRDTAGFEIAFVAHDGSLTDRAIVDTEGAGGVQPLRAHGRRPRRRHPVTGQDLD